MKDKRKSFLLYNDCRPAVESLTDADAGQLFKAILAYTDEGREPGRGSPAYPLFLFFKVQLDRDAEKFEEVCKKRSEAGKKGWEAVAARRQMPTNDG